MSTILDFLSNILFNVLFSDIGTVLLMPIVIEPNRCAMACQGCGAVFLFLHKKAVETKS